MRRKAKMLSGGTPKNAQNRKRAYEFLRKPLNFLVGMKGFEPSTP